MGNSCCNDRKGAVALKDAEAAISTGDCLVFAGARGLSQIVMYGTCASFSHTGIAVRIDGVLYVSQSTPNPGKLVGLGETEPGSGIMLTKLADELASGFYASAAYRPLNTKLTDEQSARLEAYARSKVGKIEYDSSKKRLVFAGLDCSCCGRKDCCANVRASPEDAFCSEWAAMQLRHVGVLVAATNKRGDRLVGDTSHVDVEVKVDGSEAAEMKVDPPAAGEAEAAAAAARPRDHSQLSCEFTPGDFAGQGKGDDFERLDAMYGKLVRLRIPDKTRVGKCAAFFDCTL